MRLLIYKYLYRLLSWMSNRINNKRINKYKVFIGSTLLLLTSSCQLPKKNTSTLQTTDITESDISNDDNMTVMCYESVTCYVTAITSSDESDVLLVAEQMPVFANGDVLKYIQTNIKYPPEAKKKKIQGRVIIQFIVEEDGSITNPKVVRSIDASIDSAAMEVVRKMPNWKPGMNNNGKAVKVKYTLPIAFKLPPEE